MAPVPATGSVQGEVVPVAAVLLAVLARRQAKPAFAGTEEVALVTKAQQAGHFTQAEAVFGEVLAGEFAAGGVQ